MNFPGRENTKTPLDIFNTLTAPLSVLTRRWTNSPLADCVDDTNRLNCSSAPATACAEKSIAQNPHATIASAHCRALEPVNVAAFICIDYSATFPTGTRISRLTL